MLNVVFFSFFWGAQSFADIAKDLMARNLSAIKFESQILHGGNSMIPLCIDAIGGCSGCPAPKFEHREANNDATTSMFQGEVSGPLIKASESLFMTGSDLTCGKLAGIDRFKECNLFVNLALPMNCSDTFENQYPEQNIIHSVDDDGVCRSNTCKDPIRESNENEEVESGSKKGLIGSGTDGEKVDVAQMVNPTVCGEESTKTLELRNVTHVLNAEKNETVTNMVAQSTNKITQSSSNPKQLLKSSFTLKGGQKNDILSKTQILTESLACNKFDNASNKFITKHKLKQSRKENMADNNSMTPKVSAFC